MNNDIYEITSKEIIHNDIDQPVIVNNGGELRCYGTVDEDVVVMMGGNFLLYGNVMGDVVVMMGGNFRLYGNVMGDVVVMKGGDFCLYGTVHGDVVVEAEGSFLDSGNVLGETVYKKKKSPLPAVIEVTPENSDGFEVDDTISDDTQSIVTKPSVAVSQITIKGGICFTDSSNISNMDSEYYEVTGMDNQLGMIPKPVLIRSGGVLRFFGMAPHDVTVEKGGSFYLFGTVGGSIKGEGHAEIHGVVNGSVAPTLQSVIDPNAIVKGKRDNTEG